MNIEYNFNDKVVLVDQRRSGEIWTYISRCGPTASLLSYGGESRRHFFCNHEFRHANERELQENHRLCA